MPATYEPIASTTLGSNASSVTFSDLPGTFTDLVAVVHGEGTLSSNIDVTIRFNGSNTAKSGTMLRADGSTVQSIRYSEIYLNMNNGWAAGRRYMHVINVMSYANTNVFKTVLYTASWAGGDIGRAVGLWRDTSAITSMSFHASTNNFASGSIFSLYGIKAA